ncbi:Ammonium transporter Rh type B [Nymphon striatum]|nr:Ammonium transporter Rh type B [Nymphon striatum]
MLLLFWCQYHMKSDDVTLIWIKCYLFWCQYHMKIFQDVHVMMFIGFGFLMTFLKKYGQSAVGLNFLLTAVVLQWATIMQGIHANHYHTPIEINIVSLLGADFAAAAVLISFGAVLGKTSPLQLVVMAVIEIAIFAANEHLGLGIFKVGLLNETIRERCRGAKKPPVGYQVNDGTNIKEWKRFLRSTTTEDSVTLYLAQKIIHNQMLPVPPTSGAWIQHIRRAHCQSVIWELELIPHPIVLDPLKLDCILEDNRLVPKLSDIDPAPTTVVSDVGGSMFVHVFGAYFGIGVSVMLFKRPQRGHEKNGANYNSDIFAMIGTLFLWMFWPSFNSALAVGDARHRAIINTYYSLSACVLSTFAFSSLVSKEKFDMVHIQNATLAGGVAVGTAANMMIEPYGAMLIGVFSGLLSVIGYRYIQNVIVTKYNNSNPSLQRIPDRNSTLFEDIEVSFGDVEPNAGRSAKEQSLYQLIALGVTFIIAIAGGLITGGIMRLPIFSPLDEDDLFDDERNYELEDDEEKNMNEKENNLHYAEDETTKV